jgi:hypothetical protein
MDPNPTLATDNIQNEQLDWLDVSTGLFVCLDTNLRNGMVILRQAQGNREDLAASALWIFAGICVI